MTEFKSILGYMVPASGCDAVYIHSGDSVDTVDDSVEDSVHTWPVIDCSGQPRYVWTGGMGPTNGLRLTFDDNDLIPADTIDPSRLYVYMQSNGGLSAADGYVLYQSDTTYQHCTFDEGAVGSFEYDDTITPGHYLTYNWAGSSRPIKQIAVTRNVETDTLVGEVGVFVDCSLPYNPEFSSYTITPVLPGNGSQTYTSMSGYTQRVVYTKPVYDINLSFKWSGPQYTEALRIGLEKTLAQGTPLLFAEPWSGDDTRGRRVFLLNLKELPSIQMTDRNIYTCTIVGTTQP